MDSSRKKNKGLTKYFLEKPPIIFMFVTLPLEISGKGSPLETPQNCVTPLSSEILRPESKTP